MNYDIEYVSLDKASKFNYSHILTVIRQDGVFDVVSDFYTTLMMADYPAFFRDIEQGSGAYDFLISFKTGPIANADSILSPDEVLLEANFLKMIIPKSLFLQINLLIAEMAIRGIEKYGLYAQEIIDSKWHVDVMSAILHMKANTASSKKSMAVAGF